LIFRLKPEATQSIYSQALLGGRNQPARGALPPEESVNYCSRGFRLQAEVARALIFRLKPEATQSIYSQALKAEATRILQKTESL
jgi:hypothetical protein